MHIIKRQAKRATYYSSTYDGNPKYTPTRGRAAVLHDKKIADKVAEQLATLTGAPHTVLQAREA